MYDLTPVQFYPIRSQCSHNLHQLNFLQGSFELSWKRAQHSISTSFAAKQVARFCYLFYPSLKSQSNFKTKRTKKPYFYSPILLIFKKKRITWPNFLSFWKAKTCLRINSKNNVYIFKTFLAFKLFQLSWSVATDVKNENELELEKMGQILLSFKTVNAKIHKKSIYVYELLALANKICLVSILTLGARSFLVASKDV